MRLSPHTTPLTPITVISKLKKTKKWFGLHTYALYHLLQLSFNYFDTCEDMLHEDSMECHVTEASSEMLLGKRRKAEHSMHVATVSRPTSANYTKVSRVSNSVEYVCSGRTGTPDNVMQQELVCEINEDRVSKLQEIDCDLERLRFTQKPRIQVNSSPMTSIQIVLPGGTRKSFLVRVDDTLETIFERLVEMGKFQDSLETIQVMLKGRPLNMQLTVLEAELNQDFPTLHVMKILQH